ncbi:hypothetical protein LOK74_22390 [Brevibacillus humidisoli]|uniref:hypothetical protein n=1 Tax=Brevibacillus humidisoli TaxID=2895522 RepID=UPI001E55DA20|nr:hypothetical protein [Brevibacillus humidisoli]UFJ40711.1 hypothetical protein LOK74_22390 [Brevibacillus humidisoli]
MRVKSAYEVAERRSGVRRTQPTDDLTDKRQHCGCPAWSAVDEVEVYRMVRRMPPGSAYHYRKFRDKTVG